MSKKRERIDRVNWGWAEDYVPGSVSEGDIKTAYRLNSKQHKPNTCRKNCKLNPNCLSGFGEQSFNQAIDKDAELENYMSSKLRVPGTYVGLKNLGNTCYINSLLQLWFHNIPFREAVYSWNALEDKQELAKHLEVHDRPAELNNYEPLSSIAHLQYLFCEMQFGLTKYCDPEAFCRSLSIDVELQQDAQEFNKLYMQRLEESFQSSSNKKTRRIIQEQFRGEYSYVTTCCNCSNESERHSYFYELELKVKNCNSILDSLLEFLSEEPLTGDNKYFCSNCDEKHNALTRIRLQELPPVLQLQLLRYEIDSNFGTRRKIHSTIQFPDNLDMSPYVAAPPNTINYKLIAVLMHGGSTAYSGHYYAHINTAEGWHVFDDINVRKEKQLNLASEENLIPIAERKSCGPKLKGFRSSSSVYMLVYRRINKVESVPAAISSCEENKAFPAENDDVNNTVNVSNQKFSREFPIQAKSHSDDTKENVKPSGRNLKYVKENEKNKNYIDNNNVANVRNESHSDSNSYSSNALKNTIENGAVNTFTSIAKDVKANCLRSKSNFETDVQTEALDYRIKDLNGNNNADGYISHCNNPLPEKDKTEENKNTCFSEKNNQFSSNELESQKNIDNLVLNWLAEIKRSDSTMELNSVKPLNDPNKFIWRKLTSSEFANEFGDVYFVFDRKILNHPLLQPSNDHVDESKQFVKEMNDKYCDGTSSSENSADLKESLMDEPCISNRKEQDIQPINVQLIIGESLELHDKDTSNKNDTNEKDEEKVSEASKQESDVDHEKVLKENIDSNFQEDIEFKNSLDESHWKMLPEYLKRAIIRSRRDIKSSCNSQLVEINSRIDTQNMVKTISETIVPDIESNDYEFINFESLKSVTKNINAKINNSNLICKHGKLNVNKSELYKMISTKAADFLYDKFGGGPRLKSDSLCRMCVENKARVVKIQLQLSRDSKLLLGLMKNVIERHHIAYWVGKRTLRRWTNYVLDELDEDNVDDEEDTDTSNIIKDGSGTEDNKKDASDVENTVDSFKHNYDHEINESFNDDIICPHGGLTVEENDRKLVSEMVWNIFLNYFPNIKSFKRDHSPCEFCQNLASQDKEHRDTVRRNAMKEKEMLKDLFEKKQSCDLLVNEDQSHLIDSNFLAKWRKYIRSAQRQTMLDAPKSNELVSSLLCEPHNLLLYDPEVDIDRFFSLNIREWEVLTSFYPSSQELKVKFEENGSFTTSIAICRECLTRRKEAEAEEYLQNSYLNASIYVWKLDTNQEEGDSDNNEESSRKKRKLNNSKSEDAAGSGNKPERIRRSARARQPKKDRKMFIVNKFTTLKDLKIMIFNKFAVMPTDQHLYLNGIDLDTFKECLQLPDSEATLMKLEVKPNDVLQLVADEPKPGASICENENFMMPEAGFKGTELGGK